MSGRVPGALSFLVSIINNTERVELCRQFFTWPPNIVCADKEKSIY